ncbi:hypothetical protein [Streptomyces griseorubiginosus]
MGGLTSYPDHLWALGTWVHLASKVGWQVAEADGFTADDRGEIGAVDIEGIRYAIRLGPGHDGFYTRWSTDTW